MSAVRALANVRAGTAERALVVDSGWSLATAALPVVTSLPAAIILARSLSTADYGLFTFFSQGAGFAVAVLAGASGFALSYHFNATREDRLKIAVAVAVGHAAGTIILTSLLFVGALLTAGVGIPVAIVGCLILPSAAMHSLGSQVLRARFQFGRRALVEFIRSTTWAFGLAGLAVVGALALSSAMTLRSGVLVTSAVVAFLLCPRPGLPAFKEAFASVPAVFLRVWARTKYALGMSSANLVVNFTLMASVVMLDGQRGLGILGYGWILALPFTLSSQALGSVLLPHAAVSSARSAGRARAMARIIVAAELSILVALLLATAPVVELVTGAELAGADVRVVQLFVIGQFAKLVAGVDLTVLNGRGRVREALGVVAVASLVFMAGVVAAILSGSGGIVVVGAFAMSQLVSMIIAARLWLREVNVVP